MSLQRIPSLDGLRAISITLVILSHLVKWKHVSLERIQTYGDLGVHVFFVLSGYLITSLLLREYDRSSTVSLRDFYIRRAFRIFPAAFVFLAVVVVLYWHQMRWYHVAAALLYVANMDMTRPWIFGHLWSLSIEEQFYLLWPFAVKKWHRHRTVILLCVFLATPIFRAALYAFKITQRTQQEACQAHAAPACDWLSPGHLCTRAFRKSSGYLAIVMLLVAIFVPWFPATSPARTLFMLFAVRPLLHVSLAGLVLHVIQVPYRILNWSPVAWLGKISYSVYLWQELFCSNPILPFGYALVVPTLAAACLSYYLVEQPMLRLREKRARKQADSPSLVPTEDARIA